MSESAMDFKKSDALTLGVELELQLLSQRDFDLTRGATDLLSDLKYDGAFGDVKLEITESMIEVSTLARASVDEIAADLEGLRKTLIDQCARNNIAICGGGTFPSMPGRNAGFARVTASTPSISATAIWPSSSRCSASTFMSAAKPPTTRSG